MEKLLKQVDDLISSGESIEEAIDTIMQVILEYKIGDSSTRVSDLILRPYLSGRTDLTAKTVTQSISTGLLAAFH